MKTCCFTGHRMDALKNTIGSAYDDELRKLAKAATDVLTKVNDFLSKHPAVTKALVAITAAVTGLVSAFATFATISVAVNMVKQFTAITGEVEGWITKSALGYFLQARAKLYPVRRCFRTGLLLFAEFCKKA